MLALDPVRNAAEMATVHYSSRISQLLFNTFWSKKADMNTLDVTTWDMIAVLPKAWALSVRGAGPTLATLLLMGMNKLIHLAL
eukprot:12400190-Karenia_brevis.AAC.1